jgi:hypothetical protein
VIINHSLAPGDELEISIPSIGEYVEIRISPRGLPEIFCTQDAAVFRRSLAVFRRRAYETGRRDADFSVSRPEKK